MDMDIVFASNLVVEFKVRKGQKQQNKPSTFFSPGERNSGKDLRLWPQRNASGCVQASGQPDSVGRRCSSLLLEGILETNLKVARKKLKFQAPEIDYELGGVGDVLNLPGLHKIVEQTITEQVKTENCKSKPCHSIR